METREVLKELNKLYKPIEKLSYEDQLLAYINKYEKALELACADALQIICEEYCEKSETDECNEHECINKKVKEFKKQAGLDGDE